MAQNKLLRMDNVGIVVESLDETISFFQEIGLRHEGRAMIESEWAVLVKWFSIKILTGFVTFARPMGCSSDWPSNLLSEYSSRNWLDLLKNVAVVRLNGKDLGIVWCAPWRVDITKAVNFTRWATLWNPQAFRLARVGAEIAQRAAGNVGRGITRIGAAAARGCQIQAGPIVIDV